jgi:hypothetical protein
MVEEMESLIVKIGKILTDTAVADMQINIPGDKIKKLKMATLKNFQMSPKQFLVQSETFQELTEQLKVQIIK